MFEEYRRTRQSFHDKQVLDLSRDAINRSMELLRKTKPATRRARGIQAHVQELRDVAGAHREVFILDAPNGEYCVAVYDLFREPIFRAFPDNAYARIFAIAQRKRLGLDKVTRI
ncbi:hypothetical protein [Mesorhizobium sp. WSM3859]|uniref:hypothetical protein n=1 Tax=Mesorhizobium sp. WSM3859 TaxID=2029402 RepID=UPI00114095CA|nr:hypothetical protein [Mesorhizobium sp. WSM3859]